MIPELDFFPQYSAKAVLDGLEAILQERECERCCLFSRTESYYYFHLSHPGTKPRTEIQNFLASKKEMGCVLVSQVRRQATGLLGMAVICEPHLLAKA